MDFGDIPQGFVSQLLDMAKDLPGDVPHDGELELAASSRWFGLPAFPIYGLEMCRVDAGYSLRFRKFTADGAERIVTLQTSPSREVIEAAFVVTSFMWSELGDIETIGSPTIAQTDKLAVTPAAGNA